MLRLRLWHCSALGSANVSDEIGQFSVTMPYAVSDCCGLQIDPTLFNVDRNPSTLDSCQRVDAIAPMSTDRCQRIDVNAPMSMDRCQRIRVNFPMPTYRSQCTALNGSISTAQQHRCQRISTGAGVGVATSRSPKLAHLSDRRSQGVAQGKEAMPIVRIYKNDYALTLSNTGQVMI